MICAFVTFLQPKTLAKHMDIALYQPDIPQNLGAVMRICACFGAGLHIIEPCAFPLDEKRIRRAGMDYIAHVSWVRHASFEAFCHTLAGRRLVLATTKGATSLRAFDFQADDMLLFGRESAGVPPEVHARADARVFIPMQDGMRSLNLAVSAGILAWEALRQTA